MSDEVKKLNELKSARVTANLGLDASGNLVRETVENENYAEKRYDGGGATRWSRVLRLTSDYAGGILFLTSGIWCGYPRVISFAINFEYDAVNKAPSYQIRVIGGVSERISAARMVKEGGETYLEFETYSSKIFAKAFGIGLEIVPSLPESSPAADAEITDLTIIRETTT